MVAFISNDTVQGALLQMVPIVIGILSGASCLAVKVGGICEQRVSLGIAIGLLA